MKNAKKTIIYGINQRAQAFCRKLPAEEQQRPQRHLMNWMDWVDERTYRFLEKNVKRVPKRWKKAIAYFYTDSRIRKLYWRELNVFMGENTYANIGLIVTASPEAPVIIGDHVSISPYVTLIAIANPGCSTEMQNIPDIRDRCIKRKQITIEDEVWIGANVTILPGITVGRGSVIGAGAVVTHDIEPYSVYAGVPARKLRSISTHIEPEQ